MLGIVVLNYKNWAVTKECVDSIFKSDFKEDFLIVIIDNGSGNESVKELYSLYGDNRKVYIIELEENLGFAGANNIGIDICREKGIKYVMLTNSDIIFREDSIGLLYEKISDVEDAVIIGPGVIGPDGHRMISSMLSPVRLVDAFEVGRLFRVKRLDEDTVRECTRVHTVSGCCFIIDADKFREIKAFDGNTFLYNEESILGIQVGNSPYHTYIMTKAEVIHNHGASSGAKNEFVQTEYIKSNLYYWRKYRKQNTFMLLCITLCYCLKMYLLNFRNRTLHPAVISWEALNEWKKITDTFLQ